VLYVSGQIPLKRYLTTFKLGDYVDLRGDGAIHKGMPHKFYHGRTGIVWNVTPRAVGVIVRCLSCVSMLVGVCEYSACDRWNGLRAVTHPQPLPRSVHVRCFGFHDMYFCTLSVMTCPLGLRPHRAIGCSHVHGDAPLVFPMASVGSAWDAYTSGVVSVFCMCGCIWRVRSSFWDFWLPSCHVPLPFRLLSWHQHG
jgi:hypothetical protein